MGNTTSKAISKADKLASAIKAGDVEEVNNFLAEPGCNIEIKTEDNRTPLLWAARHNQVDIAKLLLAKGATINAAGQHGVTPLYLAAYWGHLEMVTLLVENGASLIAKHSNGFTPIDIAYRNGQEAVVDYLKTKGAVLNQSFFISQFQIFGASKEEDGLTVTVATGPTPMPNYSY